jgi:hypothetical protein
LERRYRRRHVGAATKDDDGRLILLIAFSNDVADSGQ